MTIEPKILVSTAFGAVFLGTTIFLGLESSVLEKRIDELEGQAQAIAKLEAAHEVDRRELLQERDEAIYQREVHVAELQAEADGLNREVDALRDQQQELEAQADSFAAQAEAEREAHQRRLEELLEREQASSKLSAQLAGSFDEARAQLLAATQAAAEARESELEVRHLLEQAQQAARGGAEEGRLAQQRLQVAEAKVADLLGQVGKLETQLAAVIEATGVDLNDVIMPVIEGTVLAFDKETAPGLVMIDRGTKHGVKQGFTFEVYSDGLYKGRVRVVTVDEARCLARVDKLYEGRTIEKGDKAATKL